MISGAGVCCWGLTFEDIRRLYDNTPAVACTYIGSTSTSIPSASLICLLELQQQQRKSSYPTTTSIAVSWLGNKVPLIKNRENTFSPSKDLSRDSENKIPVNTPVRFPQGGPVNGTASVLPTRNVCAQSNMGYWSNCCQLPPQKQGMHKTAKVQTQGEIGERNEGTALLSPRCRFLEEWKNTIKAWIPEQNTKGRLSNTKTIQSEK